MRSINRYIRVTANRAVLAVTLEDHWTACGDDILLIAARLVNVHSVNTTADFIGISCARLVAGLFGRTIPIGNMITTDYG